MSPRSTVLAFVTVAALLCTSCSSACTEVGCTNTLRIELEHTLSLGEGPYLLEVTTPAQDLRCSVGPEATGDRSCFGFRFADLDWDDSVITLHLTEPFENGPVFESVDVRLSREGTPIFEETLSVQPGPALEPNGPGCPPSCVGATARGSVSS